MKWGVLIVLLCGCALKPMTYRLHDGEVVRCKEEVQAECGIELWKCSDGNEYSCQQNVKRVLAKGPPPEKVGI